MAWKNVQYENGKYKTNSGGGGGASALADLDDVNITSATDGQILKYNAQSNKWINGNGGGSSGHNYSTTEQVVGTWIDGKPLYEKTIEITNVVFGGVTNNNNYTLIPDISVKYYDGYIERTNGAVDGFIKGFHSSLNSNSSMQDISEMTIRKSSSSPYNYILQFSVCSSLENNFSKVVVVIRYTKTTDV